VQKDRERVTRALDALSTGLAPYVEKQLQTVYHDQWRDVVQQSFRDDRSSNRPTPEERWDAHSLLTVMWDQWNRAFRGRLDHAERSLVSELREYRNRWAHQVDFNFDDTYRILDSAERLLAAVQADERVSISREKNDLLRAHFNHEARTAYRKAQINRRKWHDLTVYLVCAVSLVFVMTVLMGGAYWFFSVFIVLLFGYLAYNRVNSPAPFFYGPHECMDCGKVIYGESCPYCEQDWRPEGAEETPATGRSKARRRGVTPSPSSAGTLK
jgi:Swt1-like HEPN